jgi:hypothetical protein
MATLEAAEPGGELARADVLDRLVRLRTILPAFAQELAEARRMAARLRLEKKALQREVDRLRTELERA